MNRLIHKEIGTGSSSDVYYNYDLAGDLLAAQFGSYGGTGITYTYDAWGRKLTETSYGRTVTSKYDASGNRTDLIYPDGVDIQYTYDVLNRMEQVKKISGTVACTSGDSLACYTYDDLGRTVGIGRGTNPATTTVSYGTTSLDRTLTQNMYGTSQDVNYAMTFTPAPQLHSRVIDNSAYAYSAPNDTTKYCPNGLNQYDIVGGTGTTCSGGTSFTYDYRGNLTYDGARTMAYDLENRLTGVTGVATLSYDPKGRLQTFAGSSTQQFQYDGDQMLAEYDSTGSTVLRRYVPGTGADETLVWYEGADLTTPNWLHTDEQGTTIATSNNSGTATTYKYSPTGEPTAWAGTRIRYTGQAALPDVALYYYRARMYDPKLGRFLQTDPVGYDGGDLNLYAFVNNDPTNRADSTGNCAEDACVVEGGLALGTYLAITSTIGGLSGVAMQGVIDISRWQRSSMSEYAGAAMGGAATADVLALGGPPTAAGSVGGFVGSLTTHAIDTKGSLSGNDMKEIGMDTLIGAGLGRFAKYISAAGPGASGVNAIARNEKMTTMLLRRIGKGQVQSVRPSTAVKAAVGLTTGGAPAAVIEKHIETQLTCSNPSSARFCGHGE